MINNNIPNKIYNQDNNINRKRAAPQDRQRINNVPQFGIIPNPNANNPTINKRTNVINNNTNQNRNTNINNNNNNDNNSELGRAFLIIQKELKKKDNKIYELERKVQELTKKYNSLLNNNNTNNNNINNNYRVSNISPSMEEEPKNIYNNPREEKGMFNMNKNVYSNIGYNNNNNQNMNLINLNNIRSYSQKKAFQGTNLNYNSDNENIVKRHQGYDNLSHSNDNSVLTYNGVHTNSKKDVKDYLKEVKEKIEPRKFKEFIRNIKLLTSKSEIAPNKESIVESMRNLFGKEHIDLFLRFEKIIGANK